MQLYVRDGWAEVLGRLHVREVACMCSFLHHVRLSVGGSRVVHKGAWLRFGLDRQDGLAPQSSPLAREAPPPHFSPRCAFPYSSPDLGDRLWSITLSRRRV